MSERQKMLAGWAVIETAFVAEAEAVRVLASRIAHSLLAVTGMFQRVRESAA